MALDIHPTRIEDLDTGHTIIVDAEGKGDFQNIQDAIDFLGSNFDYQAIALMPGYYGLSAPLTFPTSRWNYALFGLGPKGTVNIENTNGAAIHPQRATLDNLSLHGHPAVSDGLCEDDYFFQASRCQFQRSGQAGGTGAAVELARNGWTEFQDCFFGNSAGGPALRLREDTGFRAWDCTFQAGGGASNAVEFVDRRRFAQFDRCNARLDTESRTALLYIHGPGNDGTEWRNCQLEGGVAISGTQYQATFGDCWMESVAITEANGLTLVNCQINSTSNAALSVQNIDQGVRVAQCDLQTDSAPVVRLWADAGQSANCQLFQTRMHNYAATATNFDAVVATNHSANQNGAVGLMMDDCFVEGLRDGIHAGHAFFEVRRCQLNAGRDGAYLDGGEGRLDNCTVSAGRNGVLCTNGTDAEIFWSLLSGDSHGIYAHNSEISMANSDCDGGNEDQGIGGDGVYFWATNGELSVRASAMEGEGPGGRGLFASPGRDGMAILFHDMIVADGAAAGLECESGTILASHCVFYSGAYAAALLKYTNTQAKLDSCTFYGMDGANTNAAILLYGVATNAAPAPSVVNAVVRPTAGPVGGAKYSIGLAGTVATGRIMLVNSVLNTNLDGRIGVIAVRTNLINGNSVP